MQVDNRKPFDLQQALAGKPVEFRGKYIRYNVVKILHAPELAFNPVLVISADGEVYRRGTRGEYTVNGISDFDLVMSAPKMVTKTAFTIVTQGQLGEVVITRKPFPTREAAQEYINVTKFLPTSLPVVAEITWQEEEES